MVKGYAGEIDKKPSKVVQTDSLGIFMPTEGDMQEIARMAVPELMAKAVMLARESESLRDVLAVLKELADRGYGKAVQGVQINVGPDVRGAWKKLENGVIDVD